MKWVSIILIFSIFSLPFCLHAEDEQWLCAAEQATGFKYFPKKEEWKYGPFETGTTKYIVYKSNQPPHENNFIIKELGNDSIYCIQHEGYFLQSGNEILFSCKDGSFIFNKDTYRYVFTFIRGYIDGDKAGNTPLMEIGNCEPF